LAQERNLKTAEDWYSVTVDDIHKAGGARILHFYGNSLIKSLTTIYPEYPQIISSYPYTTDTIGVHGPFFNHIRTLIRLLKGYCKVKRLLHPLLEGYLPSRRSGVMLQLSSDLNNGEEALCFINYYRTLYIILCRSSNVT
jgi:hypothetical protein